MQEQIKKIQERIDGYQTELDKWNKQFDEGKNNNLLTLQPYVDMVLRMQAMYAYQITELKWVLKEIFNVPVEELEKNRNK